MNECLQCGQAGMRHVTHVCMTAIGPTPSNLPAPLDVHHWLYKAGYEQGRADERRIRDLSPMGGNR